MTSSESAQCQEHDNNWTDTITHHNSDDDETDCGIGRCKPEALRRCATMPVYTGFYSINALMTATLSFYITSQVTTLERQFGFNSSQTGVILAANDVGFLLIVLFVSFITNKVHIPRALGFFTLLFGLSGFVCALPHFMFGAPSPSLPPTGVDPANLSGMVSAVPSRSLLGQICDGVNHTVLDCHSSTEDGGGSEEEEEGDSRAHAHAVTALAVIATGMVLQGVGKTPRTSFTTTYVDANVPRVKTGFYMGIIIAVGVVGPGLGFALGGFFSSIYVTLEDTDMKYRNPNWIGAWWLGFIVFGACACVCALPLFFFPRRMRKQGHEEREVNVTELPKAQTENEEVGGRLSHLVKGFLGAIWRLCTNPVYMCAVLSVCFDLLSGAGVYAFSPKYIENQFSFPAWKANMALAGMMLGAGSIGTFIGGYLTKRFKMGPTVSLTFATVIMAISLALTGLQIAFKCDQPWLYNSPGPLSSPETTMSDCMEGCGCDDTDYFPVCGGDGRTFFSPCHAGCKGSVRGSYVNCTCIPGGLAEAGTCDYSCDMFYPFIVNACVSTLLSTFAIIPKLIIYMRAVEERDKPLALGFHSFMTSVTGWMLGPICFGKLIDSVCIQWGDSCKGGGACRLYDNVKLRWTMYGYGALFQTAGFILIILTAITARITNKFQKNTMASAGGDTLLTSVGGH
ncbi:solute carrier organic anion transporter family member 2A1-like [Babylonia areolata]|uniref:solute carrier organic anion transporter family member 2A1-like n=1 Tax=Babylonia areolata TaxID=304850 RepID=UPI003FD0D5EE